MSTFSGRRSFVLYGITVSFGILTFCLAFLKSKHNEQIRAYLLQIPKAPKTDGQPIAPPSPVPKYVSKQTAMVAIESNNTLTNEEFIHWRVTKCKNYLQQILINATNKEAGAGTLRESDEGELGIWIHALSLGLPGDWISEASNTNKLTTSLFAAILARSSVQSTECLYKQRRIILVAVENTGISDNALDLFQFNRFGNFTDQKQPVTVSVVEDMDSLEVKGAGREYAMLSLTCLGLIGKLKQWHSLVSSGGYVFLKDFGNCTQESSNLKIDLQKALDYIPALTFDEARSNMWFRKPVMRPLDHMALQRFLAEANSVASGYNSKEHDIFKMPHSTENSMEVLSLKNLANMQHIGRVCEIGFNAGHQAIAVLSSNTAIKYTSFENKPMPWKDSMAEFIDHLFPGRFSYVPGDPVISLPGYQSAAKVCDVLILGGNGLVVDKLSLDAAIEILKAGAYIFIDFTLWPSSDMQHTWPGMVSSSRLEEVYCHSTAEKIHGHQYKWCLGQKPAMLVQRDIHVVTAQCGGEGLYLLELEVMIKSILMAADPIDKIHMHIIMDDAIDPKFKRHLEDMGHRLEGWLDIKLYDPSESIVDLFKHCSTQSLTAHELVQADCAIYLDRDAVILTSLWDFYNVACNLQTKVLGLSPEGGAWYTSNHGSARAGVSYVPDTGVNGGILAMNLQAMRKLDFTSQIMEVYERYNKLNYDLRLGDQDLLNLYFVENPQLLEIIECKYNARIRRSVCECCQGSMIEDSMVLHGNRGTFHDPLDNPYKTMWGRVLEIESTYHRFPLIALQAANQTTMLEDYNTLITSYTLT